MKKIVAIIIAILIVCALVGCGNQTHYVQETNGASSNDAANYNDISTYEKTLEGLEECLLDRGLLQDTAIENKDSLEADLIGASEGYRYSINNNVFIELYSITEENEVNKTIKDEINLSKENQFSILDLDPLTGVYSSDGKLMLVYNAAIKYDYQPIADVVSQF